MAVLIFAALVELWFSFGAVVCGMAFCGSAVVHLCCGLVWQVVMWFGVGSALVQLCVANCSMVQLWFSIGTALLQLVVASLGSSVV